MWTGEARFHCERTDEDPRGDPPEREIEDTSAEDRAVEEDQRPWDHVPPAPIPLPNFKAWVIATARAQAAGVANPVTREQLLEALEVAEGS